MNREIPIIADAFVDREFGTGAVKVTPAHDPHDYEAGLRHGLPKVTVIDEDGSHDGSSRALTREWTDLPAGRKLVEQLDSEGYLLKIEDYEHNVGQCDRCSTVVEPKISHPVVSESRDTGEAGH